MMSLNTLEFLCGQTATAIKRNPLVSAAATSNLVVALAILGAFFLAAFNLHHMAYLEAQQAVITCELSGDRDAADVEVDINRDLRIDTTRFIDKDKALDQLLRKWIGDTSEYDREVLGNPLPDAILVYVKNPDELVAVCKTVGQIEGVAQARFPEQITEKLLLVARGVKIAGIAVGVVLVIASLTVITTTIRLTIYARRREIRIMQLVGATRSFIRFPFLLEGLFHGVMGGLVAAVGILLGYIYVGSYVTNNLEFMQLVSDTPFLALFAIGVVLAGALFGLFGSLVGVRKYLSEV